MNVPPYLDLGQHPDYWLHAAVVGVVGNAQLPSSCQFFEKWTPWCEGW